MKYLLIAEKPSLMRDLKACYDKHKKEINMDIDFVALAGHICQLDTPDKYEEWKGKKWEELYAEDLPLFPKNWRIGVNPKTKDIYKKVKDLVDSGKYDGYIAGEDADREGNLIHYFVQKKLKINPKKTPTLRLWLNEGLTDEKILKAFKNMVDYDNDPSQVNLTQAAMSRAFKDWLEGMNLTIGYSVVSGSLTKIGRVKTPTVKLVYDNSMAIDNFVPETHYEVKSLYSDKFDGGYVGDEKTATKNISFKTKKEANAFISELEKEGTVVFYEKKQSKKNAPGLYNLTKIQSDAGKIFGYSPKKTLDIVQSLYENHKVCSYPRTECEYVTTDISKDFPRLLSFLDTLPNFDIGKNFSEFKGKVSKVNNTENIKRVQQMSIFVNDKEVAKTSHTALIPTGQKPNMDNMTKDEKNIFYLICRRFLSIFYPPCTEDKTVLVVNIKSDSDNYFRSNGKVTVDQGFQEILDIKSEDKIIPDYKVGDIINVNEYMTTEVISKPPTRLTKASLIELMSNVQKLVEDKDKKTILKETKGIGTSATRADIIEQIIQAGYVEEKGGKKASLYITNSGKKYIEGLKDYDFCSPEFTADNESNLKKIVSGELSFMEDYNHFKEFIINTLDSFKHIEIPSVATCPLCGGKIIEDSYKYSCNNKCGVAIWKNNKFLSKFKGLSLDDDLVKDLMEGRAIGPYKMKTAKGDSNVKIKLKIDKDAEYVTAFDLEFQKK